MYGQLIEFELLDAKHVTTETGLRANELRSLKKLSFDFENCTVTVKVGYSKNSKKAVLPL
ncbi:MAG TPA: hypothetical protein DIU00_13970 [Phycisphaerales bacterium]|nr:hypothetical protein [Phycisphaerales bacterium]